LEGEFGDIDLGRELIGSERFPTVTELRQAVRDPEFRCVLMLKLVGDEEHNHHLPIWSPDGQRLALQRSKLGTNVSKLLVFPALSQPEPNLLSREADVYEYMFRWGLNSETAFVFARILSASGQTQICYCGDGTTLEVRTPASGQYFYPSLYERTDGVRWLAYERNGEVVHQAWDAAAQEEHAVAPGSEPRWSADGKRLLMSRRRGGGPSGAYEVAVRNLKDQADAVTAVAEGVVRSPVWSPDEQAVAFYGRGPREGDPWQIQVVRGSQDPTPQTVIADVVVNPDYKSEGPSWEPSGARLWCFSHQHRRQEYYPLVAADAGSGQAILADYPQRCTNPNDLAINPRTEIPEIAFVGRDGVTQDLFVLLLNHY